MTWIATVTGDAAEGELRAIYKRVQGPDGHVDNILTAHSLRPHTLAGHMALYKSALHHSANTLPKWLLEAIGVAVSDANHCGYCVDHHREGLRRELDDTKKFESIDHALAAQEFDSVLSARDAALLHYALALTKKPENIVATDIDELREAGASDGEILEVNQVTAYFAYANRTVLGLGVETAGEPLGQSPSRAAEDDWRHQQ